jgi:hypothetical protein
VIIHRCSGREKRILRNKLARRPLRGLAVLLLALSSLATAAVVPAAASTASAPPSHNAKPAAATAPASPSHVTKKPATAARSAAADCLLLLSGFSTDSTTLATGSDANLVANTSCDVGPTPWWIQIYDGTTGALLANCGSGTSCGVTVSQGAATTHAYFAYLDLGSTTWPPAAGTIFAQSHSIYITWEAPPNGFVVSLSGPGSVPFGTAATYTATTNQDVGPTPYWIEIYDVTNPAFLAQCPVGTSCSVSFTPSQTGDELVAFIAPFNGAADGAQASSSGLFTVQLGSFG